MPTATQGKFAHGVAAGFPSPKGVTLWTRVSELSRSSKLTLEVAKDKNFRNVVKSKEVVAEGNRDFTVHQHIGGLNPGHEYFYRFATKHKNSRVGRFRTLPPPDSKEKIRLGFYSCQDYEAGYFNAQAALAKADVDLVLCLGDYIYEHRYYPGPSERLDTLGPNGDGDVQTLDEYRSKYRMYQADKDLQAMHASHAFISVWDDHEVEDNYAGDQPDSAAKDPNLENNNEYPRRVPFGQRRKDGYKAFFEAMPRIQMKGAKNQIYGSMRLGGLVELFLTDQRQYRDPQPCDDALLEPCADLRGPGPHLPRRRAEGLVQEGRRQVGRQVEALGFGDDGDEPRPAEVPAREPGPVGRVLGGAPRDPRALPRQGGHEPDRAHRRHPHLPRRRHDHDRERRRHPGGRRAGRRIGDLARVPGVPRGPIVDACEDLRIANDPHVKFADFDRRGFGVVTITKSNLACEFFAVDALTRGAAATPLASFNVPSGARTLEA